MEQGKAPVLTVCTSEHALHHLVFQPPPTIRRNAHGRWSVYSMLIRRIDFMNYLPNSLTYDRSGRGTRFL